MNLNWIAFVTGLFGSLHCVGMCGPLALSIATSHYNSIITSIAQKVLYNIGRVTSYSILGALFGLLGNTIMITPHSQQYLSIISGIMMLIISLPRFFNLQKLHLLKFYETINKPIQKLLKKSLTHRRVHFIIGIFNGLLPCGFVYLALAGALTTGNMGESIIFMLCFGLGTIPLMFALGLSPHLIKASTRNRLLKYSKYFAIAIGTLFIIRGLNLGIPYLSPKITHNNVICH